MLPAGSLEGEELCFQATVLRGWILGALYHKL